MQKFNLLFQIISDIFFNKTWTITKNLILWDIYDKFYSI